MGRKYGLGKYGRSTYDLNAPIDGDIVEWIPIPVPPGFPCGAPEIWIPVVTPEIIQVPTNG